MGEANLTAGPDRFDWAGKRVLVTGAAGFLGRHLTSALLQRGAQVIAGSRSPHGSTRPDLTWERTDLTRLDEVRQMIGRIEPHVVFHLSSLADGRRDDALVLPTLQAEVVSTVNLLMALLGSGVTRVVIPGSLEEPTAGSPPSSPYAAAKLASRNYAGMFKLLYGMPVVVPRLFMCYGPGQPEWKVIPKTICSLQRGAAPMVRSPGRGVDWVYVTDAVDGLLACANAPSAVGDAVDIGSGSLVTIRDVVEKLRVLVSPGVAVDYSGAKPREHEQVRHADLDRTFRLTSWRPVVSLDEGLQRTVLHLAGRPPSEA